MYSLDTILINATLECEHSFENGTSIKQQSKQAVPYACCTL